MKTKTVKIVNEHGITSYEELIDLEGICEVAIMAVAAGESKLPN